MKYFMIGGRAVRSLPFDQLLRGDNKKKIADNNVFYKFPKGQNFTYEEIEKTFSEYGTIKSIKIAINIDYSQKGYAYVCFDNQEDAKKCAEAQKDSGVFPFAPRENSNPGQKLVNNLYFKNVAPEMSDDDIKKMFNEYGKIKDTKIIRNEFGTCGFVCYEDPANKDHGPEAVENAMLALNDKKTFQDKEGKEIKMYVKQFMNKEHRAAQKKQEMIRYKNSKKRCNLYVKNFPEDWTEENLRQLFSKYGDIENIKLENGNGGVAYAFVCFATPEACSQAKIDKQGETHNGKALVINHYEIKEIRELQQEELRDKKDWENYIAQ